MFLFVIWQMILNKLLSMHGGYPWIRNRHAQLYGEAWGICWYGNSSYTI
jgi:hypothetical protein